ncbi:MAG: serine/threonine-protein kinase, partial [Planctomycetota bacterium]
MKLGAYDLVSELGRGAMGVVWRAVHRPTRTERAVKVIELDRSDMQAFVRFQREAEALARVDGHPNIVRIHETGVEGKRAFFAMELVPGRSLRERIQEGPLPLREACILHAKVARAIAHCHAQGVIHRDLKPENVLIDETGEPRLVDFGLVRDLGAKRLTHTGSFLGTPAYMSPEQVRGEGATWATDVHGLGLVLYEALTGERAYVGAKVVEIAQNVLEGRVVPLDVKRPDVPVGLSRLVAGMLATAPPSRPQASAVASELDRIARALRAGGKVVAAGEIRT